MSAGIRGFAKLPGTTHLTSTGATNKGRLEAAVAGSRAARVARRSGVSKASWQATNSRQPKV